jgi:hypothetical protein
MSCEWEPTTENDMVRSGRPCLVGGHHNIAASTNRHRVDTFGKRHVSKVRGKAVGAQIIDHPCTEKPTGTDEFRESVSSGPEVAFTYCFNYVGTRGALVRASKSHDDADRNRLGVDLGQGNSRHQPTETVCVDVDRHVGLDCRDVSQQLTERVSHRSDTSEGVRPLIVRRLER